MEEERFSEERLEAVFHGLRGEKPELYCSGGNSIDKLCLNPACKRSMACSQKESQSCGLGVHPACQEVSLDGITFLLNEQASAYKDMLVGVTEVNQHIAEMLQRSQR
jgi:hypothetical protein